MAVFDHGGQRAFVPSEQRDLVRRRAVEEADGPDQAAHVDVHQAIADEVVGEPGDRVDADVLETDHGCVLGTHGTGFQHGEAGAHPHHQRAPDQEREGVEDVVQIRYGLLREGGRGRGSEKEAGREQADECPDATDPGSKGAGGRAEWTKVHGFSGGDMVASRSGDRPRRASRPAPGGFRPAPRNLSIGYVRFCRFHIRNRRILRQDAGTHRFTTDPSSNASLSVSVSRSASCPRVVSAGPRGRFCARAAPKCDILHP